MDKEQTKTYTNEQWSKMASELANDYHKLKSEKDTLEGELKQREERLKAEKDKYESELKARDDRMKESEALLEKIKTDRIKHLQGIYQRELLPFLEGLVQNKKLEPTPELSQSLETYKGNLEEIVKKGFMKPQEEAQLHVLTSIASATKITSSELQRALTTEAEWASKYDQLVTQKQSAEKVIEELKKQLEELSKKTEVVTKNINNVESHFKTPVVEATASSGTTTLGFGSLFSLSPVNNWRSLYPEPQSFDAKQK